MKAPLFLGAALLFLGIANLPIGYYTLLRIVVSIISVIVVSNEHKNGINFWVIAFGLTAVVFNPVLPVYLNDKSAWMPIDLLAGILFIVKAFKEGVE
jgi:hypothetical protein